MLFILSILFILNLAFPGNDLGMVYRRHERNPSDDIAQKGRQHEASELIPPGGSPDANCV